MIGLGSVFELSGKINACGQAGQQSNHSFPERKAAGAKEKKRTKALRNLGFKVVFF